MNQCVTVDPVLLWAGLKEGLLTSVLTFLFVGGLIGFSGWKRPTRMAWLHNRLMLGLIMLLSGAPSLGIMWATLANAFHLKADPECQYHWIRFLLDSETGAWAVTLLMISLAIGGVLYLIYGVQSTFLVKKTGNAAVDAAIARYRQPGERVVVGRPRLVVDGAGYYQAVYIQGEGPDAPAEPLLVREDGEVVRDEALARRVLT